MCVIDMGRAWIVAVTVVGAVTVFGGVVVRMGDDDGVLWAGDGNRLETVDTVESVGDGGDDSGNDDNVDWERGNETDAERGRNLPDLSR